MQKVIFFSFITDNDASLLHLHSSAIRSFASSAQIVYFSEKPQNVPDACRNVSGFTLGNRRGTQSIMSFCSCLNALNEQFPESDTYVFSNPSCFITNGNHFINHVADRKTLAWSAMDLASCQDNLSCFAFAKEVIPQVIYFLNNTYSDPADSRNCLETFLYALKIISHPSQIVIQQPVNSDKSKAFYSIFESRCFSFDNIIQTTGFIECAHSNYLAPYMNCHLNLYTQIRRAMRFLLHLNKKSQG